MKGGGTHLKENAGLLERVFRLADPLLVAAAGWILFPLLFASSARPLGTIAILVAVYPGAWGLGQLATGPLSDRFGRKPVLVMTTAGG